jgi:cyclohexa-1,5-dienecarbonyl-CoA hydratase
LQPSVQIDDRGEVVRLMLDRPPLNLIDADTCRLLADVLRNVVSRPELRVLVLTGAGTRAFCAGAEPSEHEPGRAREMLESYHSVFVELDRIGAVTVAAVQGVALAGGCELAGFCDLVIAEENARFGLPEIKLGRIPTVAAAVFPDILGTKHAAELILSGETIGARRAYEIGLVTRLVRAGKLESGLESYIKPFLDKSPAMIRLSREAMRARRRDVDLASSLRAIESIYLTKLLKTSDAVEGLAALLQKRTPSWKGE